MEPTTKQNNVAIPVAIVVAGALIAGALYFAMAGANTAAAPQGGAQPAEDLEKMTPITAEDHIRGNPNADIVIVEYSDFECPFCKRFHPTLKQLLGEYGDKVAWVYRHFPLDQLHPVKARKEAAAAECANEIGGNEAFWKFADRFFELTPSNNNTDVDTVLPQIAKEIGLDEAQFASCLTSGKYETHIEENVQNAVATGGTGTPWNIVVMRDGTKYPLSGAQPYDAVKQLIDLVLKGN